jgi:hypothetical protein
MEQRKKVEQLLYLGYISVLTLGGLYKNHAEQRAVGCQVSVCLRTKKNYGNMAGHMTFQMRCYYTYSVPTSLIQTVISSGLDS